MKYARKMLRLCLKAKKYGIDCFYYYSPHVESVAVGVFDNGWSEDASWNKEFRFYLDESPVIMRRVTTNFKSYLKNLKESDSNDI